MFEKKSEVDTSHSQLAFHGCSKPVNISSPFNGNPLLLPDIRFKVVCVGMQRSGSRQN
jgi:hypothetical protein